MMMMYLIWWRATSRMSPKTNKLKRVLLHKSYNANNAFNQYIIVAITIAMTFLIISFQG